MNSVSTLVARAVGTAQMIETTGWTRSCLFLILGFLSLVVSTPAQADQHVVSGCLRLEDARKDWPPFRHEAPFLGKDAPLDELEVAILFTDHFGNEHQALPVPGSDPIRTDEDGCFAALLSLVPEVTRVRPKFILDEDDRKVKRAASIWRMALPLDRAVTLAAGEAAFFGTNNSPLLAIDVPHDELGDFCPPDNLPDNEDKEHCPDDEHGDNGALQMWINAEDVVTLYEAGIGPWSTPGGLTRPKVVVRYPAAESNSNANATRMAITWDHLTSWNVFLHEFGHYISSNDSIPGSILPTYCVIKTGTTWPFSQSPYTYEDPDFPGPCGHRDWSFEFAERALSEGFADFTRYFLMDDETSMAGARYCSRYPGRRLDDVGGPTDIPRFQHFYNSVNFDGEQNETNVAQALCDLVDDEFESVTYLHQFGDEGHVSSIDPLGFVPNLGSTVGMNATHTFAAQGADIFQIEFATGSVSLLFDAATASDVEVIAADATRVCASDGDTVNCFALTTAGPVTPVTLPSGTTTPNGIRDMQLSGGDLFVMTNHDSASVQSVELNSYDAALSTWQPVYFENVTSLAEEDMPWHFAVSDSSPTAKVFLARRRRVEICSVSNCASTLTHYAGDASGAAGYQRGDASTALFNGIRQLVRVPGGTKLTIVDAYGVSAIEDGDTRLEQWIGRGLDRVFENNLSRRGLVLGDPRYASNGAREIVLDNKGTEFAPDRLKIPNYRNTSVDFVPRGYLIDSSVPTTDRFFCAEENVSLDPEDVFTMFDGNPYGTTILNALANSDYVSLTPAEETAVTQTSWINLPPPGNCEAENIRREKIDASGGGGEPEPPEEDEECGGYVEPDADDLIDDGFFDAELVIGEHEEEEQPEPIDESGLTVLTGSDCSGSGEDPNDGDGVCDPFDNCPFVANADQLDTDGDTQGDACDTDDDEDGLTDTEEAALGTDPLLADTDGDGFSDGVELDAGSDPLDANDTPAVSVPSLSPLARGTLIGLLLIGTEWLRQGRRSYGTPGNGE